MFKSILTIVCVLAFSQNNGIPRNSLKEENLKGKVEEVKTCTESKNYIRCELDKFNKKGNRTVKAIVSGNNLLGSRGVFDYDVEGKNTSIRIYDESGRCFSI